MTGHKSDNCEKGDQSRFLGTCLPSHTLDLGLGLGKSWGWLSGRGGWIRPQKPGLIRKELLAITTRLGLVWGQAKTPHHYNCGCLCGQARSNCSDAELLLVLARVLSLKTIQSAFAVLIRTQFPLTCSPARPAVPFWPCLPVEPWNEREQWSIRARSYGPKVGEYYYIVVGTFLM